MVLLLGLLKWAKRPTSTETLNKQAVFKQQRNVSARQVSTSSENGNSTGFGLISFYLCFRHPTNNTTQLLEERLWTEAFRVNQKSSLNRVVKAQRIQNDLINLVCNNG